ncbi:MAG: sodium:proton antiporter [Proteobacteria bacterium]|nr:sodium:proton antiporter [Pseudomonadota bacterium]NOG59699.1 sodium:proton antiporter [Pseudomonadota bacterium]
MLSSNSFLLIIVLLLLSILIEPLVHKIRMPISIVLVLIGFIGSEISISLFGVDTGIRWDNFKIIISYIILPVLIFQAAIDINFKLLFKNLVPILIMALPLMILSTFVTATGLYQGINHAAGFPLIAALITGALLSATDPASVISLLKRDNAPERLRILLQGESLFNDATAIVLFSILISLATQSQETTSWVMMLVRFIEVFFGGLLVGIFIGFIATIAIKYLGNNQSTAMVSIFSAYSSFILSEDVFHFSGVIAVLSCGITLGSLLQEYFSEKSFISQLWLLLAKMAESIIFLLAGITITLSMFVDQWLAILIGIVAVIFSRVVIIFGTFPFLSLMPGIQSISLKQQTILVWGGVRGTVTLALALSLPLTLDYWYTIQSIAYGVVIFTLVFQTLTLPILLRKQD